MTQFSTLPLLPQLHDGLTLANFTDMTPVQEATLPISLTGKDVIAQAKTGSGKTLAFALACLQQVDSTNRHPEGIVICPTRELADQVAEQIRLLARKMPNVKVATLCGGQPMGPQISSLKHGCNIVVGTPGRIMDHVEKRRLNLSEIKVRVLDEADRMLDMGFADDLDIIFSAMSAPVQTLMFSATYTESVTHIAESYLKEPAFVEVDNEKSETQIAQIGYEVSDAHRNTGVMAVLTHYQPQSCIVFCNQKRQAQALCDELIDAGFKAGAIHGDLEQPMRTQVLAQFAANSINVLIATDVAARGLDIANVDLVINAHVSEEAEVHVHRVGRTGRADKEGLAVSLVSESENFFWQRILDLVGKEIPLKGIQSLRFHKNRIVIPPYVSVLVDAGKKNKIRPGDFLGALTKDADIPGDDIGKITVQATRSFIAIKSRSVKRALGLFREGKIKGKRCRARKLS